MSLSPTSNTIVRVSLSWLVGLAVSGSAAMSQESPSDTSTDRVEQEIEAMVKERGQMLPQVIDGKLTLPPLAAVSIATDTIGNGRAPEGFRGGKPSPARPLPEDASSRGLDWNWSVANWAAANTFSHPRYFEDRMLERHGHERFPYLQPFASGARFFTTVPMLPYLMTVRHPCDCESTLGYYRSGSCAPVMLQRPPLDRRAVLVEAGTVAGLIVAFP